MLTTPPDISDVRTLDDGISRVDALRLTRDLEGSRWVCMALIEKHPTDARLLWRAARAESDMVILLKARGHDRERRDVAAASGLDFARRARTQEADPAADLLGQLAWSLGTTVHLQPMFDRAERATETQRVAAEALEKDPVQSVALATLSILNLRLATLPWIADLFSGDAPEGTVEGAIDYARRAIESDPSLFHHLLLGKALAEAGRRDESLSALDAGLASLGYRPRDAEIREEVLVFRDELLQD